VQLLDSIYTNYAETIANGGRVRSANTTSDLGAVRQGLPDFFRSVVAATGRDADRYKVYGSVGQLNWSYAKIPWVAICDKRVSGSTERGYYIVLLFRENMDGCVLSLNQGFTQFKTAFGTEALALAQIEASAQRCLQLLDVEEGFMRGRISLGATRAMGQGYERGAIVSKAYWAEGAVTESDVASDTAYLLEHYERLIRRLGPELTLHVTVSESAFQGAAASIARGVREIREPYNGPLSPPPLVAGAGANRYRRDPNVAALAQRRAGFRCEVDQRHLTFTSRASKANFVESHHLIPMSVQGALTVSLDVVENVIALCPTCHRLLHHGRLSDKKTILRELFHRRETALRARGIAVGLEQLYETYEGLLMEDE
jgi:5-methylcytosine-specific restriction protein A